MSKSAKHQVILRDLSKLGEYLDHQVAADEEAGESLSPPVAAEVTCQTDDTVDQTALVEVAVPHLLELLALAGADLARLVQQDQETRQAARGLLDHYEGLYGELREAEDVLSRAGQLRQDAEALASSAFEEAAQAAATNVAALATRAEVAATRLAEERRAELEILAAESALARLLVEHRRQEERRNAEAAEAERARRLAEHLAAVRAALAAGNLQEAETMLGSFAKLCPNSAEVASLQTIIRQRAEAVKVDTAEAALRNARRAYRHQPAEAIARLERVDLHDLPEQLAHQLKGVWAAACARLCQQRQVTGLFRYLPQPGFGVVVAREAAGEYRVVSAFGGDERWRCGSTVAEADLRGARPLRSIGR